MLPVVLASEHARQLSDMPQLLLLPTTQAAKALGMASVDVPGAGETDTQAVQSLVSKKTSSATPSAAVPVETVLVPATPVVTVPAVTVPAVAVSGTSL